MLSSIYFCFEFCLEGSNVAATYGCVWACKIIEIRIHARWTMRSWRDTSCRLARLIFSEHRNKASDVVARIAWASLSLSFILTKMDLIFSFMACNRYKCKLGFTIRLGRVIRFLLRLFAEVKRRMKPYQSCSRLNDNEDTRFEESCDNL